GWSCSTLKASPTRRSPRCSRSPSGRSCRASTEAVSSSWSASWSTRVSTASRPRRRCPDRKEPEMDCEECRERIYPYLDRELSPTEFAEMREHLDDCGGCERTYVVERVF